MNRPVASTRVRGAIAVLLLVELFCSLEASMVYTALPTIARQYGGMGNVTWLIAIFTLVQATTVALGARLGDLYGRRRVLQWILVLSAAGSLISAVGGDLWVIVAGRALQGVSAALLPLCFGIAREIAPQERLSLIIGLLAGMYSASGAVGFLLGGVLTEQFGWHSIFWVTLFLPTLVIPLVALFVPDNRPAARPQSLDLLGALLLVPGLAGLLLIVTYALKWPVWTVIGMLLASVGLLVAWWRHESSVPHPLIDVHLLRNRGVAMANASFLFMGAGSMQMPLVVMAMIQQPLWTGVGLGIGATVTGLLKLPSNLIAAFTAPLAGWLGGRISPRMAATVGGSLGVLAWVVMIFAHSDLWLVVALTVVIGASTSMMLAAMPSVVLVIAPSDRSSEATGMLSLSRTFGVSLGAQIAGVLMTTSLIAGTGGAVMPDDAAYRLTYASLAGWTLLALIACIAMPGKRNA